MGLGGQLIHWPDGFCEQLAARGFRVIRFDNRDSGLSSKMKGRVPDPRVLIGLRMLNRPITTPYSLLDMADDTIGLMDALDLPAAHIAGISMGGMIGQTMAITHPQRVRSLTSIMSGTGRRRHTLAMPRAIAILMRPGPRNRDEAIEGELAFFRVCGGVRAHAADEALVRDIAGRAYERSYHPAGFIRQFAAILAAPDRGPALRYVRVPTAVVHGSADPLILHYAGKATAEAIPGARYRLNQDMVHDLPPSTWRPIIDEIAAVAARAGERSRPPVVQVAAPTRRTAATK